MPLRRFLLTAVAGLVALPAAAQSTDPSFNLVNRSGQAIVYAYASPSSDNSWRADRLGRDVLPDGMRWRRSSPSP